MKIVVPFLPKSIRWISVAVVAGFLFYVSIITVPPEVVIEDGGEDVFTILAEIIGFAEAQWRHFLAYGTLAYFLAYATESWTVDRWYRAFVVIAIASLYGLGIEIGQYFIPYRFFDINDIVANTLGATLVLPWYVFRPYIELRQLSELV